MHRRARFRTSPQSTPAAESRIGQDNGRSDDIGVRFIYPANIPKLIGHNALSAMAMATPIAHKCAAAGAKVVAMHPTYLDQLGIKSPNVAAGEPG